MAPAFDDAAVAGAEEGVEATSTYWKPYFFLLESRGLECRLVDARDVKNLAEVHRDGIVALAGGRCQVGFALAGRTITLRLDGDAQTNLSTVTADIFGVSGRAMLEALIAGERNLKALAELAHGTRAASQTRRLLHDIGQPGSRIKSARVGRDAPGRNAKRMRLPASAPHGNRRNRTSVE